MAVELLSYVDWFFAGKVASDVFQLSPSLYKMMSISDPMDSSLAASVLNYSPRFSPLKEAIKDMMQEALKNQH